MNASNHPSSSNNTSTQTAKADLRRSLLKARQSIHPGLWREKSDRICTHLQAWSEFQTARTILAYFSFRQEPDLRALLITPHTWGFPRCVDRSLSWHKWHPDDPDGLEIGSYGILEPRADYPTIDPTDVDLILVPAVACDVRGYRLGYGGGFYDRMLNLPVWRNKTAIAIVFEFARLPQVPTDVWDRQLSGICTEAGLFLSGK